MGVAIIMVLISVQTKFKAPIHPSLTHGAYKSFGISEHGVEVTVISAVFKGNHLGEERAGRLLGAR